MIMGYLNYWNQTILINNYVYRKEQKLRIANSTKTENEFVYLLGADATKKYMLMSQWKICKTKIFSWSPIQTVTIIINMYLKKICWTSICVSKEWPLFQKNILRLLRVTMYVSIWPFHFLIKHWCGTEKSDWWKGL